MNPVPPPDPHGDMRSTLHLLSSTHTRVDTLIEVAGDIVEAVADLRTDIRQEANAQREAGDLRGQVVKAQVSEALSHHDALLTAHTEALRRVSSAIERDRGAPWRLVYMLLGANAVGAMGFLSLLLLILHLYSQVTGSNPAAAFRDTRELLPVVANPTGVNTPESDPPP